MKRNLLILATFSLIIAAFSGCYVDEVPDTFDTGIAKKITGVWNIKTYNLRTAPFGSSPKSTKNTDIGTVNITKDVDQYGGFLFIYSAYDKLVVPFNQGYASYPNTLRSSSFNAVVDIAYPMSYYILPHMNSNQCYNNGSDYSELTILDKDNLAYRWRYAERSGEMTLQRSY